ncbi:adenylate/guanylate cyclase domain-containing protein [Haloechinothrix sp. LS1_15]|uniref:adenylate/guanylate cyclase domain-containing protein n=1 Tax=Haloechinothrix sp. LS1_15 TaxID=2652248 RepID=UPI002945AD9B|nr:adenylate/guanylate cyclase domain-containing protein [Haloechinothrix sp. LS1_15]MDV6013840.1 YHS domain-containing protein [Haloechinothrix sp. LS1_15]
MIEHIFDHRYVRDRLDWRGGPVVACNGNMAAHPDPEPAQHTFVFADLAGFTALTEVHGDRQAAELAAEFSAIVAPALPRYGAEQVKTIGDALMLRTGDPSAAVDLGLLIVSDLLARHGYPAVRIGMHHGPAVRSGDDWFGGTVNLAARIAALASGGEVLLSEAVRARARHSEEVVFEHRGQQRLKNVTEPVTVYAAYRHVASPIAWRTDPVCRMELHPALSAQHISHGGTVYHFCSAECATRFAATPENYTAPAGEHR